MAQLVELVAWSTHTVQCSLGAESETGNPCMVQPAWGWFAACMRLLYNPDVDEGHGILKNLLVCMTQVFIIFEMYVVLLGSHAKTMM